MFLVPSDGIEPPFLDPNSNVINRYTKRDYKIKKPEHFDCSGKLWRKTLKKFLINEITSRTGKDS